MTRLLVNAMVLFFSVLALPISAREGGGSKDFESDPIPGSDRLDTVSLSVDRGAPHELFIWRDDMVSYSGSGPGGTYAGYCLSETDASTGACPIATTAGDPTVIRLRFTERRTQLSVELVAIGRRVERSDLGQEVWTGLADLIVTGIPFKRTRFSVSLPSDEIARLPVGGIWDATLTVIAAYKAPSTGGPDPNFGNATWTSRIVLSVTDTARIQVYLPAFGDTSPSVDLNLRGAPNSGGPGATLSGHQVVDACLYDGFNAYSDRLDIRVDDLQASHVDSAFFRVRHENATANGDDRDEIPYTVMASDPSTGAAMTFVPGKPESFAAARADGLRLVTLPSVSAPVVCVPWPITLETPEFLSANKRSGRYTGVLRVTFSPSAVAP